MNNSMRFKGVTDEVKSALGGGGSVEVVTSLYDWDNDVGLGYDKHYDEILEAVNAGKFVILRFANVKDGERVYMTDRVGYYAGVANSASDTPYHLFIVPMVDNNNVTFSVYKIGK